MPALAGTSRADCGSQLDAAWTQGLSPLPALRAWLIPFGVASLFTGDRTPVFLARARVGAKRGRRR